MSTVVASPELFEEDPLKCTVCSEDVDDPVLLNCLHSACRSCTGNGTINVTCKVCRETTDTPTAKANLIISSLAQRSLIMKDVFSCTQCIEEEKQDATAVAWCYTCQHSLCVGCNKYQSKLHSTHKMILLNESTNLSELYRPPVRSCRQHDKKLMFACFTCKEGRCYMCAHSCYQSSHEVFPLESPDALQRMNDSVTQATRVLSELNTALAGLEPHLILPEKVESARGESRTSLKKAKKIAMDAINKAYENASESLLECWETLAIKSIDLRESAELLKTKVYWINKYCELALNSNDIAGLLPQLDAICYTLKARLEEAQRFKEPVDPSKLVRFNTYLPSDLDSIANEWFGLAKVVNDDFHCSIDNFSPEEHTDYYKRRVSTLKELDLLLQCQREQQELVQMEHQAMAQLKSEMILKDQQLDEYRDDVKKLMDKQLEQQEQLARERVTVDQLQAEITSKTQQLIEAKNEIKQLMNKQKEQQEHLARERRTVEQLQAEVKSKTQQLAFLPKPLSFDSQARGTFKGPGRCWDVAVTPQGSLLVAAMADGLKEYNATSLRETATWKPDSDLLGQQKDFSVRTVDVLSDGRALVGLYPKLVVLLRRNVVGGSSAAAAAAWQVERRVAELQAAPRQLSALDDRLLAVIEDRYDETKKSWLPGPGLALFSLCKGGDKQLHRQQLDYNAGSVALTDRGVIVSSDDQVEVSNAVGGGNRKCWVVDCYSHLGVRLWRHAPEGGGKVMSVCSNSVGRVIYAAKWRGPVVALSGDDGRELSTVLAFSTSDTETSYAIGLEAVTQRQLVVIREVDGDEPNNIKIFTVA